MRSRDGTGEGSSVGRTPRMRGRQLARWLWPLAIVATWGVLVVRGIDPRTVLAESAAVVQDSAWFALALLGAYAVRGLVLLPATLLTVLAGFALGTVWGSAVALAGTTTSALIAYLLARTVGSERAGEAVGRLGTWRDRLRAATFRTTLVARLALLPGDLVNLAAGASRVPWRPFALATAIGGAPGLVAAVLAGASLQGTFAPEAARIAPGPLLVSVALAVVTALLAVWMRRRAA